uniref:Transcription factor ClrB-I2 n=1 Tax=Penicillium oxalicum TaxID=69781 RepID=A0A1C9J6Y5_PENOX|nr:transcription factor ClrB-I2 [Penicillium oxalicum]
MPSTKKNSSAPLLSKASRPQTSSPSASQTDSSQSNDKMSGKAHKRSRSGCFTCRLRRKKCDEKHPACGACINLSVRCEYKRPVWWGNADQRKLQKERIKNKIKQTKMIERNGSQVEAFRNRHSTLTSPTSGSPEYDFNRPMYSEPHDMFSAHLPVPGLGTAPYGPFMSPYEIDVKTERQTYINDVPMRHDSSTSTFSAFAPPQLSAPLPTFGDEGWFETEEYFNQASSFPDMNGLGSSVDQTTLWMQSAIPVSEQDQPLLDHFIHNVLRQIFPVLEVHQRGHVRAQAILRALETNKCYLHCCLSVAAIHLKTTEGIVGDQIDEDIMRHRYEAISQLCQALGEDTNLEEILDATLAMIFFHCSVGPSDDHLPDIPWFDHFQAASNLVDRLGLPARLMEYQNGYMVPSFNMALTSWIDILGCTMTGKTPQFAHSYRAKHLSGTASGLRELMGCDDRIMYLISEIACLDSLKAEGRVDDLAVCSHVQALGRQLEYTEPADQTLENPFSSATGSIRPEILTKTMSTIFRLAARIYLCSLVPGFDRNQASNESLIAAITHALQFIPAGPHGFDRSLVWPLLMAGVYSTPSSSFRSVLADRAAALGDHADLGSFGRMYRLLQEVWRLTDDPVNTHGLPSESYSSSLTSPISRLDRSGSQSPTGTGATLGGREIKRQQVQWRDIMRRNNWHYLLI